MNLCLPDALRLRYDKEGGGIVEESSKGGGT
jgi:hypothetical protein